MEETPAALGPEAARPRLQCMLRCAVVRPSGAGEAEARWNERALRFFAVWQEALRNHGIVAVGSGAEGLVAASPEPAAILAGAIEARASARADPMAAPVPHRVAMHVGTVSETPGGGWVGADAVTCERMLSEARTGQFVVSEACAGLIRHAVPAGLELRDIGERPLVGLDRPIRMFELVRVQHDADAPVAGDEPIGPIRILLVEDDRMLREALAGLLRLDPDFDLVGTAPNGKVGVAQATSLTPDVVLMDIEMPEMNGIEATRRIREALPDTEVLILTKFGDDESVFDAIRAGALGYMLKDAGIEEIGRVVRSIRRKEGFISPALVPRVMREFSRISRTNQETRELFAELSRREIEVLELLGAGLRNRAIGERLFISEKTVKNHISNILAKLQVNDRTAAALIARDHGMARSDEP
ncbi:MAG: response regulator [Armatimonadetes bacterium]|nr:response regulator [Armatimonadota bacterium]